MNSYAKIEAAEIEERYARGWHCLGLASDFTNTPKKLNYFGTQLVAFRGEDGDVKILDSFCPHMGADLSKGWVEGNSLRCPFHSWRWGGDGVTVESRLLVSHVPSSTESFDLRFGVMVKLLPGLSKADSRAMVDGYVQLSQAAFFEDVEIWHNKVRVDNPILCDGDGPVNRLRQWYSQFYVDAADVPSTWDEEKVYDSCAFNPIPEHRLAE